MPERDERSSNMRILQGALLLCALALPLVAFNLFATSQQNDAVAYWALALTATFALLATVFILWASRTLVASGSRDFLRSGSETGAIRRGFGRPKR